MSKVKLSPIFLLRNWLLDTHRDFTRSFLGKVLTILDACVQDKEQRKGIKDLVQGAFYDSFQKRYPDKEFTYILADWFEKYCPEMSPKTSDEQAAFGGIALMPNKPSRMKYFQNEDTTPDIENGEIN
jgi:hypothetical protein